MSCSTEPSTGWTSGGGLRRDDRVRHRATDDTDGIEESGSLIPWDTLGEYGRTFVAQATNETEVQAFHGPDAEVMQPIRAYVGLDSADTPEERAELAARDLERGWLRS